MAQEQRTRKPHDTNTSSADDAPNDQPPEAAHPVQSLTDLFDQLDRAAFRRTLAQRDAQNEQQQAHKRHAPG